MKSVLPILGWCVLGVALLVSFVIDLANTAQGGAIDLRNRITGVRLLVDGLDAYHYKWTRSEPEVYCDPYNNPKLPVNKTTATPTLLLLHLPLAPLPYRIGQFLWFFAQWGLLLGTGWIWLRACGDSGQRWLVALFLTSFTYTAAWRLHAERGQAYVLLLFLFAAWLTMTLRPKPGWEIIAGFTAGFLAALRPPFLLLMPFLAVHRRGQLAGAAVGLLVGVALPMFWNTACWPDYFSAMQSQSQIYRSGVNPSYAQAYPSRIEGIPTRDILAYFVPIPFADFSAHRLLAEVGLAPFPALPVLLAVIAPFAAWLWFSRREKAEDLLPGLVAWFFLADLFLPAFRNNYDDVMIIDLVALAFILGGRFSRATWPCQAALPVGWCVYALSPHHAWMIDLPTLLYTVGALMFVFLFTIRGNPRKV